MAVGFCQQRKVRTAEQRVFDDHCLYGQSKSKPAPQGAVTVRATVTNRVAPDETTKLPGVLTVGNNLSGRQSSPLQLAIFTALDLFPVLFTEPGDNVPGTR